MVRPTLIDLNPVELKYYPSMINLDKCSESCSFAYNLSKKICVRSKTKDIILKAYNIITRINKGKTLVKHILCDCKCKYNSTTCNSNQKWNNKTGQCECKNYRKYKNDYSWNPNTCACENSRYLKSIADDSKIVCNEIIYVMDIASTIDV